MSYAQTLPYTLQRKIKSIETVKKARLRNLMLVLFTLTMYL